MYSYFFKNILAYHIEIPPRSLDTDQITSPSDFSLMEMKKKRRLTNPSHKEPVTSSLLTKNIVHCDIGASPPQQKLAPIGERIGYKEDD
jgi:hypothetical protein